MSKETKIALILNLAAKKPFEVLKARAQIVFTRHGHDNDLYICEATGQILTREEINAKYNRQGRMVDGMPRITGYLVCENNEQGEITASAIHLLAIERQELIFK